MSIAIITIRDGDEDTLDISVEFEPPIQNDDAEHPMTHLAAMTALLAIQEKLAS